MKKWFGKLLPTFLMCTVGVIVVLIGAVYYNFISRRIYEDSTSHLREIYGQVNSSFGAFVERNWGLLDNWGRYIALRENDGDVAGFVGQIKARWGFSDFYFLSGDKTCMTADGVVSNMLLDNSWDSLLQGDSLMAGEALPDGREVTVFAVPAERGEYRGFAYEAVAVSYTNEDMANSLNVDSFSGESKCFVIHQDGRVLLSTQVGGNIFSNYLMYLNAASDLDKEELDAIQKDWENGNSGLFKCKMGGADYCVMYQPVGYQDYVMLSTVPQSAVSAGFLSVQKATVTVLIVIFLLVGAVIITLIVLRNHKQSRRTRMELQYRERMFDVLSNTVDDIFIMLNSENQRVDYISPNIERLLGIPLEEAKNDIHVLKRCAVGLDIVIPKPELEAIPLNGSRSWEYEYMHQSTGERRWYRMTIYHMDIQGVKKYIAVMSDRTLEQQMNQKLQEALNAAKSANEAKSNFLSNMSHDIRTPMNAIVGFSVLLEKDADQADKVREYTHKIMASSHHLLSLINDVLDMSKIESGKTSLNVDCFSLPELLEELNIIVMPQAKAKNQDFSVRVKGRPPERILGDKLRLNQILINLLSNAIKYTPDEGRVEFTVRELTQDAPQYVKLQFVVRDSGIGMSKEFLGQIFNPFSREINSTTNKIQGTGLGMAITKNLVDLMGGIIRVESQLGKGSVFTVELSFALPEQDELEAWFRNRVTRILVADDERDVCLNIQEMMRGTGVDVAWVTEGAAAVDAAVQAHRRGEDFHVILLDWKMPEMDGVETARAIREQVGGGVPILVLTSYDWSEIEDEARDAGINAFMPKPFFASTFWQSIKPLFAGGAEQKPAEDAGYSMEGLLFLVAEDNELNAEILTEMLKIEGAGCELASNGLEALEAFEKSEPGRYDMILMDIQMPVMNGYEATRKIRGCGHPEAKTIPIVAMTANTFAEDVRNALDAGMDGHLAKPINMDAVRELVKNIMSKSNKGYPEGGAP